MTSKPHWVGLVNPVSGSFVEEMEDVATASPAGKIASQMLHRTSQAMLQPQRQTIAPAQREQWIQIAESLKPRLHERTCAPVQIVQAVEDPAAFGGWRMQTVATPQELNQRTLRAGDHLILDFGEHLTGRFTFAISAHGRAMDAPCRLRWGFGEVPREVVLPFEPFTGGISRSWLQDEILTLDLLPATVTLPRRYAFRYARLEVIATSHHYGVRLDDAKTIALTSAGDPPPELPAQVSPLMRQIDEVSIRTLRECMQTVFEDGPKRDRRLWLGDLRLQALANAVTFRRFDLVRRCLYLFAGLARLEDGIVPALVVEDPKPARGHEFIIDYAALYGPTLLDYAQAAGDWDTARDLWPVVCDQLDLLATYVGSDDLFAAPEGSWVFIDWNERLDRQAAMHAVFVYGLRQSSELAKRIGASADADRYAQLADRLTQSARRAFFDPQQRLFVSGPHRQISWATQAWMILAGIATLEEGSAALDALQAHPDALRPVTPYLYHHVVDAMIRCNQRQQAMALIESYWGAMVQAGADTFWEVFDQADPNLSPYNNVLLNSACHAWSCTPTYFLRCAYQ